MHIERDGLSIFEPLLSHNLYRLTCSIHDPIRFQQHAGQRGQPLLIDWNSIKKLCSSYLLMSLCEVHRGHLSYICVLTDLVLYCHSSLAAGLLTPIRSDLVTL